MMRYAPYLTPRGLMSMGQQAPAPAAAPAMKPISKTEAAIVMSTLTIFGAGSAWIGIRTGMKESGFPQVAGWTVGVMGGFIGLFGLTCLLKLATGAWVPGSVPTR